MLAKILLSIHRMRQEAYAIFSKKLDERSAQAFGNTSSGKRALCFYERGQRRLQLLILRRCNQQQTCYKQD